MEMNSVDNKQLKQFNSFFFKMIAGAVALHVTLGGVVAYNLTYGV